MTTPAPAPDRFTHIGFVGDHCGDKPLLQPSDFKAACEADAAEDAVYGNTERSWWCAGMFPNASNTNNSHRVCPFWEAGRFGAIPNPHAPPEQATLGRGVPHGPEGLLNMSPSALEGIYAAHRRAATAPEHPNAVVCGSHAVFGGLAQQGSLWFNMSSYVRRPPLNGSGGVGGGPIITTDHEEDLAVLQSRQCPHFAYLPSGGAAIAAVLYRHANPPLPAGAGPEARRRGIVFHGDSMMRQLFLRHVASVRSEPFPLDRYFHSNAVYMATAAGDELLIYSPGELVDYDGGSYSGLQRPSSSPYSRRLRILAVLNEWFPGYLDGFLADGGYASGGLGEHGDGTMASWRARIAADARVTLQANGATAVPVASAALSFAELRGLLAQVYAAAYPRGMLFAMQYLWEPKFPPSYFYTNTDEAVVAKVCSPVATPAHPLAVGCNANRTNFTIPAHPLVRYTHLALVVGGYHYWELGPDPAMVRFTDASREHLRRNKGQRQVIINVPRRDGMQESARAVTNNASAEWLREEEAAALASAGGGGSPQRQRFLLDFSSIVAADVVPHMPEGVTDTNASVITSLNRIIDNTHFMCGWLYGDNGAITNYKQHHSAARPSLPRRADPDSPLVPVHFLRCRDPMNKALSQWLLQTLLRVEF